MELSEQLYSWMHLVGRILFGVLFLTSGLSHLTKVDMLSGYAQSRNVPAPKAATIVTGFMILIGSVFVILGWHRFIGAGLIFLFLLAAAFMVHAFWKFDDPMMKANEMAHFWKNVALAGAALLIAFYARYSWPMSLGG